MELIFYIIQGNRLTELSENILMSCTMLMEFNAGILNHFATCCFHDMNKSFYPIQFHFWIWLPTKLFPFCSFNVSLQQEICSIVFQIALEPLKSWFVWIFIRTVSEVRQLCIVNVKILVYFYTHTHEKCFMWNINCVIVCYSLPNF